MLADIQLDEEFVRISVCNNVIKNCLALNLVEIAFMVVVAEDGSYTVTRRRADGTREAVFTFAAGTAFPTGVTLTDERGQVKMRIENGNGG